MTTKTKFRLEFRSIAYPEEVISNSELQILMDRAEKHIRTKRSGLADDFDFLSDSSGEEALFWYTCLFAKVSTGELDAQDLQIGAVDQNALLAKNDDKVTQWYRNASSALNSLNPGGVFQSTSPSRTDRQYEPDSFARAGESTEVDNLDL